MNGRALAWLVSLCAAGARYPNPAKNVTGAAGTGSHQGVAGSTSAGAAGSSASGAAGASATGAAGTGAAGTGAAGSSATGAAGSSSTTGAAGSTNTGAAGSSSTSGAAGTTAAGTAGSGAGPGVPDSRGIYGHPDAATNYPSYTGFTPFLIEEFNAADDLKLAKNNPKDQLPDVRPTVCTGADGMVNAPCGF